MADDVPEHLRDIIRPLAQELEEVQLSMKAAAKREGFDPHHSWAQQDAERERIQKEIDRLKGSQTFELFPNDPSADARHQLGQGGTLQELRERYSLVEDVIDSPHHQAIVENLDPRLRAVLEAERGEAFRVMPRYLQHSPPETQRLFADVLERTWPSYTDVGFPQGQMDDPSWTRTFLKGDTPAVNITLTPGAGGTAEILNIENIAPSGQARGAGRELLQEITGLADTHKANLTLTPISYSGREEGIKEKRLRSTYEDMGFTEHRGRGPVGSRGRGMFGMGRESDRIYPMVRESSTQLLEESIPSTGSRTMANQYPDYPYYVYDRETGGVLSGWEFAEDAQDALVEIEEISPGRARTGSARAYKQRFGNIPSQSDWVEDSAVEYLQKSRLGPQDEFNLMYGGDEGFAVEEGFEDLMRGFEPESELDFEARRRLSQRQAKGIRDVDEAARRTVQREKADRVAQAADSRREERFMRALQQSEDRNELMVLMNEDRVVDDLPPPRAIEEIVEDPRYFERFNEDPRYSLNRSGVISQRLAEIDEQISALSTHPDLDNALPEDPEAGKLTRKLDELSKERDYLRSWKQQTDQSSLARGMAPEAPRGEPRGSWTPDPEYVPEAERTGMVRREDPVAKVTSRIQQREMATAMSDPFEPEKLAKVMRPADQQRARDMGERLSKALKVMEAEFLDSPSVSGKLIKLRRAAAKLAPVLVAIGDLTLAAELGYNIGKKGSISGGVMETGADFVEGVGMIAQAPAGLAGFVPGHERRQEMGLLTPPEVAAEGLAVLGRGAERSMGAYRREEKRKKDRAFIARNTEFYMDMNPARTEAEARSLAVKKLRMIEDAPPGGYPQRAPEPVVQRSLGEEQEQMYNDYLLQEGYLKRGTGRHEGALLQGPRTRKEGGYPTMSEFKDQQALSDGFPAQSGSLPPRDQTATFERAAIGAGLSTDLITPKRR